MNPKNIDILVETDAEKQIHHLKILDRGTKEIICRGDWCPTTHIPMANFEGLIFMCDDSGPWVSFASLEAYINKPVQANIVESKPEPE